MTKDERTPERMRLMIADQIVWCEIERLDGILTAFPSQALRAKGLHIVSDADMRVLEACKSWAVEFISYPDGTGVTQYGDVMSIARAELARREGK